MVVPVGKYCFDRDEELLTARFVVAGPTPRYIDVLRVTAEDGREVRLSATEVDRLKYRLHRAFERRLG
jgi:hypothetical protein